MIVLSKNQNGSTPEKKITGQAPGGRINGSVDGKKVSPPPKKS
jgi:hypothetical protein